MVHRAGIIDCVVHYRYSLLLSLTTAGYSPVEVKMWMSEQTKVQLSPNLDLHLFSVEQYRILEKEWPILEKEQGPYIVRQRVAES